LGFCLLGTILIVMYELFTFRVHLDKFSHSQSGFGTY